MWCDGCGWPSQAVCAGRVRCETATTPRRPGLWWCQPLVRQSISGARGLLLPQRVQTVHLGATIGGRDGPRRQGGRWARTVVLMAAAVMLMLMVLQWSGSERLVGLVTDSGCRIDMLLVVFV